MDGNELMEALLARHREASSLPRRSPAEEVAALRAAHAALLRHSVFKPGDLARMKPELLPPGFLSNVCPSGIFLVVCLLVVRSDRPWHKNRGDILMQFTDARGCITLGKFDTRYMETVSEADLAAEKPHRGLISNWHRYTTTDGCQIKGWLAGETLITTSRVLREEEREPIADVPVTRIETEDAWYDILGRELGE